jgi:hypothetical protein
LSFQTLRSEFSTVSSLQERSEKTLNNSTFSVLRLPS